MIVIVRKIFGENSQKLYILERGIPVKQLFSKDRISYSWVLG